LCFAGHQVESRESLLLALQHDPLAVKLLATNIGQTYYFERDYQKAADSLRRTLADNPTDPQALRWLAATLGQLGRVDEARKALSEALAKAPARGKRFAIPRLMGRPRPGGTGAATALTRCRPAPRPWTSHSGRSRVGSCASEN
jgi:predicted Zn-dependent protease